MNVFINKLTLYLLLNCQLLYKVLSLLLLIRLLYLQLICPISLLSLRGSTGLMLHFSLINQLIRYIVPRQKLPKI